MKEIGGYIELDTYTGSEYHPPQYALNCGRNALAYLLESRNIGKLHIPYYLCDSVSQVCEKHCVPIEYYHIDSLFQPLFDADLKEGEYLYIVNYYGQITNHQIVEWQKKYARIIVDNAQAYFQMPVPGVDTLYSCRKFFGVPDGAYLYTDSKLKKELDVDVSYERMRFLLGRYEKSASEFYPEYVRNNELFAGEPLKKMSKLTHNLLRVIDYESIKNTRNSNFEWLHNNLKQFNSLKPLSPDGAFMYPLYIRGGCRIRVQLQKARIYIPILWPNVRTICPTNSLELEYVNNILPIPVDQRYSISDMSYIVEVLNSLIYSNGERERKDL